MLGLRARFMALGLRGTGGFFGIPLAALALRCHRDDCSLDMPKSTSRSSVDLLTILSVPLALRFRRAPEDGFKSRARPQSPGLDLSPFSFISISISPARISARSLIS